MEKIFAKFVGTLVKVNISYHSMIGVTLMTSRSSILDPGDASL